MTHYKFKYLLLGISICTSTHALDKEVLDDIYIAPTPYNTQIDINIDDASSSGVITEDQLKNRPLLRPTEVLESIPGLTVTQHSGAGKANQYFLRGVTLDHGTDFYARVNGVPINLPTHAHGQGYLDLNFLIPELIDNISYTKGPYFADLGDFSSTGSANINYKNKLDDSIMSVTYGSDDYARLLNMGTFEVGDGTLLYAIESGFNNGPWEKKEKSKKLNGVLSYSKANDDSDIKINYLGYDTKWNATNQVPKRAIDQGIIGRFGTLDPTDGGDTNRQSLDAKMNFYGKDESITSVSAYATKYSMDLYSNFTFNLDNPIQGDQIYQKDDRTIYGGEISNLRNINIADHDIQQYLGASIRHDDIDVGLFNSTKRKTFNTISDHHIKETSLSFFYQLQIPFDERYKATLGLRSDTFNFDKLSDANSNNLNDKNAHILSPKIGFEYALNNHNKLFINAGTGFHSNDARGVLSSSTSATPLVKTKGAELGWERKTNEFLSSLTLWTLENDSELVFAGDSGTTEPTGSAKRVGLELSLDIPMNEWLLFDIDATVSRARYDHPEVEGGAYVPESTEKTLSLAVLLNDYHKYFGGLKLRYLGSKALTADNSVRSSPSSLLNLKVGKHIKKNLDVSLDILNALDSKDYDIEYYYASRLSGESMGGIDDRMVHPNEPFGARLNVTYKY
ncbi:MAG: Nicel/Cobalt-specific TonB-dependent outer membrane receptor [uncultured Sulfurovum sp.]|uniref:Nicel/Cobalt-specific TonB-dependent outer membrane receptor n=1 Tax=uncultured Sulfurovum sp. TaxID=269237 RepID=A0A6S6SJA2_9BACT|nr:MAG: Nicel/Cobalt-specific TonB-dependent outer membrane receptor [uncultured Sulfurovum sp.]